MTAEFKKRVRHCGIENINHQVLIQPAGNNKPRITDVTQLVGKTVVVEKAQSTSLACATLTTSSAAA